MVCRKRHRNNNHISNPVTHVTQTTIGLNFAAPPLQLASLCRPKSITFHTCRRYSNSTVNMFVPHSKPFVIKAARDLPRMEYTMFKRDENILSDAASPANNKGVLGDVAYDGTEDRYWIRMKDEWVEAKLGALHPSRTGYALSWREHKKKLQWETKAAASSAQRRAKRPREGTSHVVLMLVQIFIPSSLSLENADDLQEGPSNVRRRNVSLPGMSTIACLPVRSSHQRRSSSVRSGCRFGILGRLLQGSGFDAGMGGRLSGDACR
jgi:hypothetical protein